MRLGSEVCVDEAASLIAIGMVLRVSGRATGEYLRIIDGWPEDRMG